MAARREIAVVPTGAALGADVWNVNLADLTEAEFAIIRNAWLDHGGVLRFPCQRLSERELLDFGRRFGDLDRAPISVTGKPYRPEFPELTVISNVVADGKAVGALGAYESKWHTDMSYNPVVPRAAILHAVEIPRQGGDTSFCDMYRAFATLPADLQRRLLGYHSKHDSSHNSVGQTRFGFKDAFERRDEVPGAVHPMVIAHPDTGRPALFLGRRRNAFVVELPDRESDELLDFLWDHATRPDNVFTQVWRLGDVVMWDNFCTMHRRDAFDPESRRLMMRTAVKGGTPVAARAAGGGEASHARR